MSYSPRTPPRVVTFSPLGNYPGKRKPKPFAGAATARERFLALAAMYEAARPVPREAKAPKVSHPLMWQVQGMPHLVVEARTTSEARAQMGLPAGRRLFIRGEHRYVPRQLHLFVRVIKRLIKAGKTWLVASLEAHASMP